MARSSLIKGGLGLQKSGGMQPPKIRPPRLAVSAKTGMMKGAGFGAGGLPNTIAAPPAISKKTQGAAEQEFARGGRVSKPKGKSKGKK